MNDAVSFAIEIGKKILNLSDERNKNNEGENELERKAGIVRRAVDFPSLMYDVGFPSAFLFYLSKVDRLNDVLNFYAYLLNNEIRGNIKKELEKKEGAGYAGYVAILLYLLKRLNRQYEEIDPNAGEEESLKKILNVTEKFPFSETRLLASYLIEIKKVLEALQL